MHHHFDDIIERAGTPSWWDRHGFPRYGAFSPDAISNLYAREAVLLRIACQACATRFRVCMTDMDHLQGRKWQGQPWLARRIRDGTIHYGDPPNTGCCPAGPTMNCLDLRVLEYWVRVKFEWQRDHALEVSLPDSNDVRDGDP